MEQLPDYTMLSQMSNADLQKIFGVRDIFTYELDFASLAAAGTATSQFTVEADSNFLWQAGMYMADIGATIQTDSSRVIPLITCTIQDSGSGRQLMNTAVPIPSLFGTGQLPFILPTPRFFRAQTTVSVNLTNYSGATTYNLKLQFHGTKFFKFASLQG